MLNILDDVIILESFMSFHYDHVTMTVTCDMCDTLCDHHIMLNPKIEMKIKLK